MRARPSNEVHNTALFFSPLSAAERRSTRPLLTPSPLPSHRYLRGGRQGQGRRRPGLREEVGHEAAGHAHHAVQDRPHRHARVPRLRRPQRRRPHPGGQGAVRSPVAPPQPRGPRHHRVHHQVRRRRAAALHAERRRPPLRHQHPHRRLRQGQQGAPALPDGALGHLLCMVRSFSAIHSRGEFGCDRTDGADARQTGKPTPSAGRARRSASSWSATTRRTWIARRRSG